MVAAGAMVAVAPALVIAEPAPKTEWVEVDAAMMCAMVAREYRGREVRDLVTVSAATAVEKRTDSFEVYITPKGADGASIDVVLGPIHVWGDDGGVRAVHASTRDTVFEAPVEEGDVLGAIVAAMPPIPMPQAWVAMSDAKRQCPPMGPYLGAVSWTRAELSPEAKPPRLRMFGTSEGTDAAVEMVAVVEPVVRIESIVVKDDAASSTIEIRIEPLEEGATPPAETMDGRRVVGSLAELVGDQNGKPE